MNYLRRKGTTETRPVTNELTGGIAGKHVEHWDDHVDATVFQGGGTLHVPPGGLVFPDGMRIIGGDSPYMDLVGKHGQRVRPVLGGAWTASGLYALTFIDILDGTQLAIDTSLTSHKWAMYNNTETPNYTAEGSGYSATNEVSGTGYTAGGQTILTPTTTDAGSALLTYDMADQVWASPTSVTAYGAKLYADLLAGNNLIVGMNFAGAFTSTAGTFTIQFAGSGVFTIDLTP